MAPAKPLLQLFSHLPFDSQKRLKLMLEDQPELVPVIEVSLQRYQQLMRRQSATVETLETFIISEIKRYLANNA